MDTNHSPIISPLTMRESARGITLTSIYDEMLARRELSVMGNIETPMAHDLCQQIRLLDATDPSRPITIFVASAGGSSAARSATCSLLLTCPALNRRVYGLRRYKQCRLPGHPAVNG